MPVDLLSYPRCRPEDLGLPMPDDRHAVSACLPLWSHNIGYEEGDPNVIGKLQATYPRFCFHPTVQQLCDERLNSDDRRGLPFASKSAASRAVDYVRHAADKDAFIIEFDGQSACGVSVQIQDFPTLKQYWQHAGENVSSRAAELVLQGDPVTCLETDDRRTVRQRVAEFQGTDADNVLLFPSGMAAIACTWRAIQAGWPGPTCQFGFPYVDTLKIQQRFFGGGHHFLPLGDHADIERLEQVCQSTPPTAVFCEVPTNPLLVTPDLPRLRQLADRCDFMLVVDDTLAACGNLDVLRYADVLVTSLTKFFSGYGNVLAGAITLNPAGGRFQQLRQCISDEFEETLSDADVSALAENSADFRQRIAVTNRNAAQLAEFLRQHDAVESTFYPSANCAEYEALRTTDGGYGGLLSVVLRDPERTTPAVFDALEVCKGPNLGTNFTLCCPYTILAHFTELDFAERCGVSRWLLRISVGTEPFDELQRRFAAALEHA